MKGVWVSLVVGIIVFASLFYVYSATVSVSDVRLFIQYNGDSGYLASNIDQNYNPYRVVYGASNYSYPGFTATGLKQVSFQLSLASNASSVHRIISIQAKTVGFAIISYSPPTPIVIQATISGLTVTINMQCPFLGYNGELQILLVAST